MSSTVWACDSRSTGVNSLAVDRQLVVFGRVEVLELVDPIQNIRDQLLEEQPRGDPDLSAELAGDGAGEKIDVFIGCKATDSIRRSAISGEQVTNLDADFQQPLVVEG